MPLVSDIINRISEQYPPRDISTTNDTVQCGDISAEAIGVAVMFMPTLEALRKAKSMGANLIIAHEPLFYGNNEVSGLLQEDGVARKKLDFLTANKLVVWKFHDGTHFADPDLIETGLLKKLDWEGYRLQSEKHVLKIPSMSLGAIVTWIKESLGIPYLRIVGDPNMPCESIGIRVGAPGRNPQIKLLGQSNIDVLITGEIREWEANEYARDAIALGLKKGLIVLGHANSEEHGIEYVSQIIRDLVPSQVKVTYIPTWDSLQCR